MAGTAATMTAQKNPIRFIARLAVFQFDLIAFDFREVVFRDFAEINAKRFYGIFVELLQIVEKGVS